MLPLYQYGFEYWRERNESKRETHIHTPLYIISYFIIFVVVSFRTFHPSPSLFRVSFVVVVVSRRCYELYTYNTVHIQYDSNFSLLLYSLQTQTSHELCLSLSLSLSPFFSPFPYSLTEYRNIEITTLQTTQIILKL